MLKALYILFIPLISFLYQIFLGKILKEKTPYVSLFLIFTTLVASLLILFSKLYNKTPDFESISWLSTGSFKIDLGIYIDGITGIMLVVVSLISFLVHLYSIEYMKGDSRYSRYFAFLGLFTFSMNGIVLYELFQNEEGNGGRLRLKIHRSK